MQALARFTTAWKIQPHFGPAEFQSTFTKILSYPYGNVHILRRDSKFEAATPALCTCANGDSH